MNQRTARAHGNGGAGIVVKLAHEFVACKASCAYVLRRQSVRSASIPIDDQLSASHLQPGMVTAASLAATADKTERDRFVVEMGIC